MRTMIGVPTYRRPGQLRSLLEALCRTVPADVAIVVVDNDVEMMEGQIVCADFPRVTSLIEPSKGVSHVRNRLLDHALTGRQNLIFLDDDQVPSEAWWGSLCSRHEEHPEAVIAGHVEFVLPPNTSDEVKEFFAHVRQHADGSRLKTTGAGNSLIPFFALRRNADLRFALELNEIGGEDTFYFESLNDRGIQIIWSTEAHVFESVIPSRAQVEYVRERAVNSGLIRARIQAVRGVSKWTLLVMGSVRVIVGAGIYALASAGGKQDTKRRARLLYWSGLGFMRIVNSAHGKEPK